MAAEDRIGAAYHEAGHAIVLWVFGLQVDSVAIGIAGDDGAGHTKVMGSDEHLSEFDRIVISEAGLEAQEVFEAPTHDHAGLADYAKIIDILGDISAEESLKIRTAARERAREIILANRTKVDRLAEYLSFPKTSSGRIRAMRQTTMVVKRERCGDCHALEGEYHELGCDLERCPFCGGQLISCDCCYEILNIGGSPGTRVYEFGLTPEQRKQWERTLNDKGRVPFIMYPNMCAKCGKLWPEMFSVPDKEWERYVEKGERDKMLCKPCYDQIKIWIDESRRTETA